jgi:hypothetical protein
VRLLLFEEIGNERVNTEAFIFRVRPAAYERVQHERLALKLGLSGAWIREVLSLQTSNTSELSELESLVQQLTRGVVERRGHNTNTELEAVIKATGHKQAIALLMLIGRYVMHALIANCLALEPPVSSPLEG